jgi:hypothetical protein
VNEMASRYPGEVADPDHPLQDDGTPVFKAVFWALFIPNIALIVLLILARKQDVVLLFIMGAILGVLIIIQAIIGFILLSGRKKRIKIPDFDDDHLPRITEKDFDRFIGKDKNVNLLRPQITMSRSGVEALFSEAVMIYKGTLENKLCVFCKLDVRKNQTIYSCPYCTALFHKEHLLEWLKERNSCPVCQGKITIKS